MSINQYLLICFHFSFFYLLLTPFMWNKPPIYKSLFQDNKNFCSRLYFKYIKLVWLKRLQMKKKQDIIKNLIKYLTQMLLKQESVLSSSEVVELMSQKGFLSKSLLILSYSFLVIISLTASNSSNFCLRVFFGIVKPSTFNFSTSSSSFIIVL